MPAFSNFEAWILCGDKKLEEFCGEVSPQDDTVFICWIPSEAGKTFSVHWKSLTAGLDTKGIIDIDGVFTGATRAKNNRDGCVLGVRTSKNTRRPFIFANMKLTDDETIADGTVDTKDIGEIRLRILLARARFEIPPDDEVPIGPTTLGDGYIHESSKKLCSHRVGLGKAINVRASRRTHRVEYCDNIGVTFVFKYRPRAFLEAQGIIQAPSRHECEESRSTTSRTKRKRQSLVYSDTNALESQQVGAVKTEIEEEGEDESIEVLERQLQKVQAKIAQKNKRVKIESFNQHKPIIRRGGSSTFIDLTLD